MTALDALNAWGALFGVALVMALIAVAGWTWGRIQRDRAANDAKEVEAEALRRENLAAKLNESTPFDRRY